MTSKEKAEDLYDRYNSLWTLNDLEVKQCALIAVDEIINAKPTEEYGDPFIGNRSYDNVSYWQEVKQEIEKL